MLGDLLSDAGKREKARETLEAAIALFDRAGPNAMHQADLANCYYTLSAVQNDLGLRPKAIDSISNAIALLKPQGTVDHAAPMIVTNLALFHRQLGDLLRADGRPGDALASYHDSARMLDRLAEPALTKFYALAIVRASIVATVAEAEGALSRAAEAAGFEAMAALRRAVAAGYRDAVAIGRDRTFDALRSRRDFQLLLMDLAFPADPFVR